MIYIGIDCGLDGAIVRLYDATTNSGVEVYREVTPTMKTGKGNKRAYDLPAMRNCLWGHNLSSCRLFAILERQQPYPKQGGVSNFSTGLGFGVWRGLLAGLQISHEEVHPKTWQKAFGITGAKGDTKTQSILTAKRLFPGVNLRATERCTTDHDGMADALLIAEWGRRHYGGKA